MRLSNGLRHAQMMPVGHCPASSCGKSLNVSQRSSGDGKALHRRKLRKNRALDCFSIPARDAAQCALLATRCGRTSLRFALIGPSPPGSADQMPLPQAAENSTSRVARPRAGALFRPCPVPGSSCHRAAELHQHRLRSARPDP